MPRLHPAPTSERSCAPAIAQGVLGVLALVQTGLVISAVMKLHLSSAMSRAPEPLPILSGGTAGGASTSQAPLPARLSVPEITPVPSIPAVSGTVALSSLPTAPAKVSDKPRRPVLPAGREIQNPRIAETVEAAREVRKMGDMKTALEALRNADLHEPNHPEILSEMALTYEAMGLGDKSQAAWHRVAAMGEANAGGYYLLARSKLDGAPTEDASALSNNASEVKPVSLGKCEFNRAAVSAAGEKVTLRIPIKPVATRSIHAAGINPEVYLFDQLADGSVVQSVATQSPARWIPAVVDWSNPQGALVEMDFTLPVQTAEFVRAHGGARKIHGYMVKLYHDYKLMGEQAEPEQLLNFKPQSAAPLGAENALFPRN